MCATKKQLAANRRNAQKSTGPKTDQGKAISSQNHLKHGLYSGNIIINTHHLKEDQAEFDSLLEGLISELHPEGILQNLLVQKIAESVWRRRRLISPETAQINRQLHLLDSDMAFSNALRLSGPKRFIPPQDNIDDMISIKSIPKESSSLHMLRYEMRLDRQFINSLRLLTQLQKQAANRINNQDVGQAHLGLDNTKPEDPNRQAASRPDLQNLTQLQEQTANRQGPDQLCENPEPDHPRDSIKPAPRRKYEHSNPTGTSRLPGGIPDNPNSDNELRENPQPDHLCNSIKVPPAPRARSQRPAPCWIPSPYPSPACGAGGEGLLRDGANGKSDETKNEHSNPTGTSRLPGGIPDNPKADNQLCENQEPAQSRDSTKVPPAPPRRGNSINPPPRQRGTN